MRILGAVLVLAACGDNAPPAPDVQYYRYVVSELHIPSTGSEAVAVGLDINDDRLVDNRVGVIFSVLAEFGFSVADTARDALLRGGLIMLAELQTTALDDVAAAGFTTYLGSDPSPAPCTDPSRLETCGQHLAGTGRFLVVASSASDQVIAPIADGTFVGGGGIMPVEITLDDGSPSIRVDLHNARVRLTAISETHVSAVLAGGITRDDVSNAVIPQARAQFDRIVRTECGQPSGDAPCGCLKGSRSALLQSLFDSNGDCLISIDELANNELVGYLFDPDVTLGVEQPLLSFGVGVELVPARFRP